MGNCHVVGPDEVMVVSGGCFSQGRKIVVGACAWAWWGLTDVQKLSLNIMTLEPECQDVETKFGVALTVTGVAQVMIMAEDHMSGEKKGDRDQFMHKALQQFLGKSERQIHDIVLQTFEGHLRSILGTMSVEEVYQDRETFAQAVTDVAAPDVAKMGLEIISFIIKDVKDRVGYLESLGVKQASIVKRDADVGRAEADRDAGIRKAQCEKEKLDTKYKADTNIANSKREFEIQSSEFNREVNIKTAEANQEKTLQEARMKQKIRTEELEVEVVRRKKMIEVEEQEVLRVEKELVAKVHRPAEAERFKMETLAEANRTKVVLEAQADAERTKSIGLAEAYTIQAVGEAQANAMKARANAYKNYGDAAIMSIILETLPKIAGNITAPLSRTNEIVLLGGNDNDSMTNEVTRMVAQLPTTVHAVTGVDISKAVKNIPGFGGSSSS